MEKLQAIRQGKISNISMFLTAFSTILLFSGTVVDDVVTLPERYDFFLVSQSVRQGTVNPTSYK